MDVNLEPTRKRPVVTLQHTSKSAKLANALVEAHEIVPTPCYFYTPILRENDDSILREAARVGDINTVRTRLGSLGLCSTNGRTALMEAAMNGHLDIVKLCMLEVGATTIPTNTYNLPASHHNNTSNNPSSNSVSEDTTDIYNYALTPDNLYLRTYHRDLFYYMNQFVDFANSVEPSHININESNSEVSETTNNINSNDMDVFHVSESRDTPSQPSSDAHGSCSSRQQHDEHPVRHVDTNSMSFTTDDTEEETSESSNSTVSSNSSRSASSSTTSTSSRRTISSMNSTTIINREKTKVDTTFYVSSVENRSFLLSPWSSTYSHYLQRFLTEEEMLRTPKSYRKACEGSYIKAVANTALTLAINNHHRNTILFLIDKEIGMAGVTQLMVSAVKGDIPRMLLSMEYINARDANKFTALSLATMFEHIKAAELIANEFIDMPAYPTRADPLIIAAKYNLLQHLGLFLEVVPKPITFIISLDRIRMALIEAARAGSLEFLKVLLSACADDNNISANIIVSAAENGHLDCIKYLAATYPKRFTANVDLVLISAIRAYREDIAKFICNKFIVGARPRPSPLFFAVISGNEYLLSLVRKSSRVSDGITPLMIAAATGDIVGLVQYIGDARKRDMHGLTALMYAAMSKPVEDPSIYKELIRLEAGLNCVGGLFAIAHAIKSNNLGLIECLLDYEATMIFSDNLSVLDIATEHGSPEAILTVVEYASSNKLPIFVKRRLITNYSQCSSPLLEAVEDFDNDGVRKYLYQANHCTDLWSPLQKAVFVRNQEAVTLLLCELGYINTMGCTALSYAVTENNIDAAQLLLPEINCARYDGKTCLMIAASMGFVDLVKLLIPYDVRKSASNGDTALMYAAIGGYAECVKLLLLHESGIISNDGSSALMCAAANKNVSCARLLVEKEKGMISHKGYTALALSMQENCLDVATMLYEYEKDVSKVTDLMWAAFINDIDAINEHIDQAGAQTATLATALMYAATANNVKAVEILLPYEKQLVDDTGHSALMYAIEAKAIECVKVLLPYEGNLKTFKEKNIEDIAKHTKSEEVINIVKAYMNTTEKGTQNSLESRESN